MYMLGPADRWNEVPETPYIGQVFLLHPENTAPGIKGYVTIQNYGIQARTSPVNSLPLLCLSSISSIGPFLGNSNKLERPAIVSLNDFRGRFFSLQVIKFRLDWCSYTCTFMTMISGVLLLRTKHNHSHAMLLTQYAGRWGTLKQTLSISPL